MPPAHRVNYAFPPAPRHSAAAPSQHRLAAAVADIAARTSDPVTRAELHGIVRRMAALERAADELIAEVLAENALPGEVAGAA